MVWQDVVISGGQFIFAIALIPAITGKDKPPLTTSLLTGSILWIFALTFSTLLLWISAASSVLTGSLWLIWAWQKFRQNRNETS